MTLNSVSSEVSLAQESNLTDPPLSSNIDHPNRGEAFPNSCDEDQDDNYDDSDADSKDDVVDVPKDMVGNLNGWTSWGFKKLVKLVTVSKGFVSKPVLYFIKKHLRGTKLIFVMGQSGKGKTTMLRELTGLDLTVGYGMASGTLQYQVCPAIIDGEQYLFVDTAGFGAADLDNMSNFQDIMSCLSVLGPFVTVAGVLFVYGPPQERIMVPDMQTTRWIECFCGPEFFKNITVVTSQWDKYNEESFEEAWKRVQILEQNDDIARILNPPDRYHGGFMYHHGLPGGQGSINSYQHALSWKRQSERRGDELRKLIRAKYGNMKPAQLQIMREMERGIPIDETEAAKVLNSDVVKSAVRIVDGRAVAVSNEYVPLKAATASPEPSKTNKKQKLTEDKPKKEGKKESPRPRPEEQQSWWQRICGWMAVASEASSFFEKAKKAGYESSNRKDSKPAPTWNIWSSFQRLWSW